MGKKSSASKHQRSITDNQRAQLQTAIALHQQGNLAKAEVIYKEILRTQSNNFDALQFLAVIALQRKHYNDAVELFKQALFVNPHHPASLNNYGLALLELKRYEEALASFEKAIAVKPDFAQAFANRGTALQELKRYREAAASYEKAIAIKPNYALAFNNYGLALQELQRFAEALTSYDKAISLKTEYAEAYSNRGNVLQELKRFDESLVSYERAIALNADYAEAYSHQGNALLELKRYEEAIASFEKAIDLRPDYAHAYNNYGLVLQELKRYDDALASYDRAIAIKADYAEAYSNRSVALQGLKRYEDALLSLDMAIAYKSDYANSHNNYGIVLQALKRYEDALACYDRAVALKPEYAEAYSNRGVTLYWLKRPDDALLSLDRAIAFKADYAEAYCNRGNVLQEIKRYEDALASYASAIALKKDYAQAYFGRGNTLTEMKQYEEALADFEKAIAIKPDGDYWFGAFWLTKMRICDWDSYDDELCQLSRKIKGKEKATNPFAVLASIDSPSLQKEAAQIFVENLVVSSTELSVIARGQRHDIIRVGYFSADFCNHPLSQLTAELYERHDRTRFEISAFSFGRKVNDELNRRVSSAVDTYIEVHDQSDLDIAKLSREMGIDIAVDLGGFTSYGRTGIFAHRAASVQINYLGYPGTMGAEFIDYIIADPTLIPEYSHEFYTEKIAYLPNSYMINSKRTISDKVMNREMLGLQKTGVVFCCFNNNYKITPRTFDSWMRILKQVEGSVLWLIEDNPKAADNLRREAVFRGVNAERLVFAKRMTLPEHLARHRVADLFLDTLPYNAHTTASDALLAGLPVLTCMGKSFASRVAGSLLKAIDLPELITTTQGDYEALAIELATHPDKLKRIRRKLDNNRLKTPLFDSELFTKHIEEAYTAMYERYQADLPPDHLYVRNS